MSSDIAPGTRAGAREWAGLAVLALPVLLMAIDNSVLFLAMPHLSADLEPSGTQLLWIMDVYGFMVAGFLLTMGALGDRFGHRRLLLIGAAAFGVASALAAYSTSPEMIIAARALLGVAGAALAPPALALISTMFTNTGQRATAVGVFTACFMGGAAFGPVVGGVMLERFWWGSVFLLGIPVMVLLLVAGPLLLPEHRGTSAGGRVDPLSVLLSLAAIIPIIYGLKELAEDTGRPTPYLSIAAGLAVGALFAARQNRLDDPLLDLRLFRGRSFTAAMVILLFVMIMQGGIYFFVSQYLQTIEGFSPLRAGLWLMAPALALGAMSLATPALARRYRPGVIVGTGLTVSAAGILLVAFADSRALVIVGLVIAFLGAAPVSVLGLNLVVNAAPAGRTGSASAMAESSGEFGVSLGVAVLGSVGTAVYQASMDVPPGAPAASADSVNAAVSAAGNLPERLAGTVIANAHDAFMDSLAAVAVTSAVMMLLLAAVSLTLLRSIRPLGEEESEEQPDAVPAR
ncbi:MFS transporter [Spirillospora sp. CA-294931]|uniref:MFS transporter n=1 Tax=Spirillospora sp. CA-294931 TaxID=3240042 RepID=UPI003D915EE9